MSSAAENAEDFGGGGGEFGTDSRDGLQQEGEDNTKAKHNEENDNENENIEGGEEINGEDSLENSEEKMEVQDEDNKVHLYYCDNSNCRAKFFL